MGGIENRLISRNPEDRLMAIAELAEQRPDNAFSLLEKVAHGIHRGYFGSYTMEDQGAAMDAMLEVDPYKGAHYIAVFFTITDVNRSRGEQGPAFVNATGELREHLNHVVQNWLISTNVRAYGITAYLLESSQQGNLAPEQEGAYGIMRTLLEKAQAVLEPKSKAG